MYCIKNLWLTLFANMELFLQHREENIIIIIIIIIPQKNQL